MGRRGIDHPALRVPRLTDEGSYGFRGLFVVLERARRQFRGVRLAPGSRGSGLRDSRFNIQNSDSGP